MGRLFISLIVLAAFLVSRSFSLEAREKFQPSINDEVRAKLKKLITEDQVQKTTKFEYPYSMYKQKGTYSSYIHQNLQGNPETVALRNAVRFYDDNSFVTIWVTSVLLEIHYYDKNIVNNIENQLLDAITAIGEYHDKNAPKNDSIMVFWPQSYNQSTRTWTCSPTNLEGIAKADEKITGFVYRLLKEAGLGFLWDKIGPFIHFFVMLTNSFYIPSDFDDTFINIGMGQLLKEAFNSSSTLYNTWLAQNSNPQSVLDSLKRYAYRPFSKELDSNVIDPRTYFYLRDFIYLAQSRNQTLALVPTWVLNLTEDRVTFYKEVTMPFHLNNIDLTVSTNTLYGLTSALLSGIISPDQFDEDIQMIYENTTSVIAWEISHNFSSRPDLSLTYYPSAYTFLWFTSRVLNLLNRFYELPLPVLYRVRSTLSTVMKNEGTRYILDNRVQDGEYSYFDDFLGDKDEDILGKPVNHADDRIFTTSMAVNALFYIWAPNKTFSADVNHTVTETLTRSCNWLNKYAVSGEYKPMNAFFSGSVKSNLVDLPFFYPANFKEYLNGTKLPDDYRVTIDSIDIVVGMSGIIPEDEYKKMLTQKHFDNITPMDFHGLAQSVFPFWSSEPFTFASTLLALTQCKTIH